MNRVGEADAETVNELFALAFYSDPIWSWAFPDPAHRMDQLRALWALFMHSAVPYGWVWTPEDGGAASLWIPPERPELGEEDETRLEPLVRELTGARADEVLTLIEDFDSHHPRGEPHYYLSLLGTHPEHRGHGEGMALLADNLGHIDDESMPAYLESSNRSNDRRYERLGFELIDEFTAPSGGPTVGCMWRAAR